MQKLFMFSLQETSESRIWGLNTVSYIKAVSKQIQSTHFKEKSTEKIDGAIAAIMGLDRAIRCGNVSTASVYDDRGILFI